MLEQALEDVDGRPERRDGCAVLDLAVPAAVRELLGEEPVDERRHVDAEVRAGRHDVAVDAWLDLALEEPVLGPRGNEWSAIAPRDVLLDTCDRRARPVGLGVQSQ